MSAGERWKRIDRLAVVGAGAWGTALATLLARKGLEVDLWAFEQEVTDQISRLGENQTYLPGIKLPNLIKATNDLKSAVKDKQVIILVTPSHVMRAVLTDMSSAISPGAALISAAKGVENETLMTMTQVMTDVLPRDLAFQAAVLSGPSFAREVAQGLPTAITLACSNLEVSSELQMLISAPTVRVYTSQDLIGVELGGALKNIYALAAGASDGLGLGTNARAAMITRSLAEMTRLGVKMGANPLTFMGLAGLGDLVLTCTGDLSRNRQVGLKLAGGKKLKEILGEMKMVAEGVKTTRSVYDLARREKVDMPISEQVYLVLYRDKDPATALIDLMTRSLKEEIDHGLTT